MSGQAAKQASNTMSADDGVRRAEALRDMYTRYNEDHDFSPGELICWKPGLNNVAEPKAREPVIVLAWLDEPKIVDWNPIVRDRYDLLVGVAGTNGDCFHTVLVDSRRFHRWNSA